MTRRLAIAAAALTAVLGITAQVREAGATTSLTRQCISKARANLKAGIGVLRGNFSTDFANCFGPGLQCANTCAGSQATCLTGTAANPGPGALQALCLSNTDPNHLGVSQTFTAALKACSDCAAEPANMQSQCFQGLTPPAQDKLSCATNARVARVNGTAACQTANQPGIDACNSAYSDCLQSCASCPPGDTTCGQ
jgi:hypothetical protein